MWEKISGPQIGKWIYFWAIWIILWIFGIFYDHSVYFVFIWYIFPSFGIMHQEKSGNPEQQTKKKGLKRLSIFRRPHFWGALKRSRVNI
jgi:hypothetical protein